MGSSELNLRIESQDVDIGVRAGSCGIYKSI